MVAKVLNPPVVKIIHCFRYTSHAHAQLQGLIPIGHYMLVANQYNGQDMIIPYRVERRKQ